MTGLLSLPNELLIQILGASPTTGTLLRLAHANRRMRAIWIAHSEQIIAKVYCPKIQYFQDAMDLTLAEARQVALTDDAIPTEDAVASQAPPLFLHLPHVLRNVGLATRTCDRLIECFEASPTNRQWLHQPRTPLYAAYFLVRRVVLAYSLPGTRLGLHSEIRSLTLDDVETGRKVMNYIIDRAPRNLKRKLGCMRTEVEMEYVPAEDRDSAPPLCWSYAERLLRLASEEKEEGAVGKLEDVWTRPLVDYDYLDVYDSSDLTSESESDSDLYSLEYVSSDAEQGR